MAKYNYLQNALIGGEVTPLARGRTDIQGYKNSLEDCENMIPFAVGGAARRPGTYCAKAISAGALALGDSTARLIPWEISSGRRFLVALGGGQTLKVIDIFSNAVLTVNLVAGTVALATIMPNFAKFTYQQAKEAQFIQVGDILFITGDSTPHVVLRFNATDGDVDAFSPHTHFIIRDDNTTLTTNLEYQRVPYLPVNVSGTTMASSNTALGATVITAGAAYFSRDHVGAIFKFGTGAIIVTGYTNSTTVDGEIIDVLASGAATISWEESAWSDYQGWPRTVGFFEGRLVYGGSKKSPDTLWFSQDGDVNEKSAALGAAAAATDAFSVTPNNAETVSKINWMITGNKFAFGTEREEFTVYRPDASAGFSVTNIAIAKQTSRGSKYIQAVRIESAAYFVASDGQRVVEFVFDERENNYRNRDINIFADHVFAKFQEDHSTPRVEKQIASLSKQSFKDQRLWVLDEDGGFYSCVIDRNLNINAWSIHYLGGNGSGDDSDPSPFINTCATINNKDFPISVVGGHEILYFITTRTINNTTGKYLEFMDEPSEDHDEYLDFKPYATVTPEIVTVTSVAFGSTAQADYINFSGSNGSFAAWLDKDAAGTVPTGAAYLAATYKIKISILTGDTAADCARKLKLFLEADKDFAASKITLTRSNDVVTMTHPRVYYTVGTARHNANDSGNGSYTFSVTQSAATSGGASVSGTAVTGLTNLAGETVTVVADGKHVGDFTVTGGGGITLNLSATTIDAVGFKYKSRIKTIPVEAGSQIGSALGSINRIDQARIHFYRSANASVGSVEQDDDSNLDEVLFRPVTVASSLPIPLYTGYKILDLGQDYEREAQIVVETQGPLGMTITHIALRGQTSD